MLFLIELSYRGVISITSKTDSKSSRAKAQHAPEQVIKEADEDIQHGPPELFAGRAFRLAKQAITGAMGAKQLPVFCRERDVHIRALPTFVHDKGKAIRRWLVLGTLEVDDGVLGTYSMSWTCAIGHCEDTFIQLGCHYDGKGGSGGLSGSPSKKQILRMRSQLERLSSADKERLERVLQPLEVMARIEQVACERLKEAIELGGGRERLLHIVKEFPFTKAEIDARWKIGDPPFNGPRIFHSSQMWDGHELRGETVVDVGCGL